MPNLTQAARWNLAQQLQEVIDWATEELAYVAAGTPDHLGDADAAFYYDYVHTVRQAI